MRCRKTIWMIVVLMTMALSGCGSIRYVSSLKPSGDKDLQLGQTRYCLSTFAYDTDKKNPGAKDQPNPTLIFERAKALYPNIFTDEWTALPVRVAITTSHDSGTQQLAYFLTGFCTLGIIPFPGSETYGFKVDATVSDYFGQSLTEKHASFVIEKGEWGSILPWGALPVPGFSDLPRDTYFGDQPDFRTKIYHYAADCIVESVVQSLRAGETDTLAAAYRERKTYQQELTLDGKPYQSYLLMTPATSERSGEYSVLLYQGTPRRTTKPLEQVTVARQDASGQWRPVNGYLHTARSLTAVGVLMEKSRPAKVVLRAVDVPPLADFIDTPDLTIADCNEILRWNNGVLLDAKNHSLPTVLQEESRDELLSLVTRIEQAILDLNEKSEQAKDRAQAKVEKGEGDPAPDRELAVLCRQRIEVLKPILAAIKEQAALKKP